MLAVTAGRRELWPCCRRRACSRRCGAVPRGSGGALVLQDVMERAMRPGFVLGELVAGEQHGGTAPVFHGKAEKELGLAFGSSVRFGSVFSVRVKFGSLIYKTDRSSRKPKFGSVFRWHRTKPKLTSDRNIKQCSDISARQQSKLILNLKADNIAAQVHNKQQFLILEPWLFFS